MNKPFLIGICGGSGSGKTSFINSLREYFDENQLCIISFDEYYHPREHQITDDSGIKNFDLPESIDHEAFREDLVKLGKGQRVDRLEYVFNNPQAKAETKVYLPAPVVIVEGLFIYHFENIRSKIDLKLFIDTKEEYKIIRRIKRDQSERNYPLEDVLYRYEYHVAPAYEKYIRPYKELSDLIVNNNYGFDKALDVLQAFIQEKIRSES